MLRLKSVLIGSLLVVWQLGCDSGSLQVGPPGGLPPPNPQANISILPANAVVGSADLTLMITGTQAFPFAGGGLRYNKVLWSANGSETELPATVISGSQLTAIVPAVLLTSPLQAKLRVEIWDRQADNPTATSSSVLFSVTTAPVTAPFINSISPESVAAGSSDVTLTITGSNFDHTGPHHVSVAFWTTDPSNLHDHGTILNTTVVSSSQLIAVIPAALLQNPVAIQIVVLTGDPMGMSDGFFGYPKSNSVTFTVTP